MRFVLRWLAAALVLALAWPGFARYRNDRVLATARTTIHEVIAAGDAARAAREIPGVVATLQAVPPDPRRDLMLGLALILARQPDAADRALDAAVARHERPELTLNLGRARAATGDEAGARAAFLRSGWAAPGVLATLPAAMRREVEAGIAEREPALAAGDADVIPPLR